MALEGWGHHANKLVQKNATVCSADMRAAVRMELYVIPLMDLVSVDWAGLDPNVRQPVLQVNMGLIVHNPASVSTMGLATVLLGAAHALPGTMAATVNTSVLLVFME